MARSSTRCTSRSRVEDLTDTEEISGGASLLLKSLAMETGQRRSTSIYPTSKNGLVSSWSSRWITHSRDVTSNANPVSLGTSRESSTTCSPASLICGILAKGGGVCTTRWRRWQLRENCDPDFLFRLQTSLFS